MKRRPKLILLLLVAVFCLLFVVKFVAALVDAGAAAPARGPQGMAFQANQAMDYEQSSSGYSRASKNYASAKTVIQQPSAAAQVVEQKYERVASLGAHTDAWDTDRKRLDDAARQYSAVLQQEDASGLAGRRQVVLGFGVVPDAFEGLVSALREVGTLDSIAITKTDRTADFKALAAKRLSLEKTRDGLRGLKVPGAPLADLISLESRILEIEGQIQELGVSLGDFDENNSLCTVKFTLSEKQPYQGPDLLGILLETLAWTAWLYAGLLLGLVLTLGAASLIAWVVERFRTWMKSQGGGA